SLRREFEIYVSQNEDLNTQVSDDKYFNELIPTYKKVKSLCYQILRLNEKAMLVKNENAKIVSKDTELYMIIIAGISILFVIIIIIKVPGMITKPISELTEKV